MTPQKKIGINIAVIILYVLSVLFVLGDDATDLGDRFLIVLLGAVIIGLTNLAIFESK